MPASRVPNAIAHRLTQDVEQLDSFGRCETISGRGFRLDLPAERTGVVHGPNQGAQGFREFPFHWKLKLQPGNVVSHVMDHGVQPRNGIIQPLHRLFAAGSDKTAARTETEADCKE